jgi:hypothetical protein
MDLVGCNSKRAMADSLLHPLMSMRKVICGYDVQDKLEHEDAGTGPASDPAL